MGAFEPKTRSWNRGNFERTYSFGQKEKLRLRWETRVIKNGWHKLGAEGAMKYLQKYGKNIGTEKLRALAWYAETRGAKEFADMLGALGNL